MKAGSNLEKILTSGQFAVTGELGPPKGADVSVIERKAKLLKGNVDSINVTDNQTAIVRMSSIAVSAILIRMGLEPNMQMVCRDRNRIAMQSDIFGAYALGIRNILCLSGDHQKFGNHPTAKNVFDLDSMQLIQTVKRMRDEHKVLGGRRDRGASPDVHRGGGQPLCRSFRVPGHPSGQEGGCRGGFHPDPVYLRHGQV